MKYITWKYICTECDSDKLEQKAWVNINTGKLNDYVEDSIIYCCECNAENKWKEVTDD